MKTFFLFIFASLFILDASEGRAMNQIRTYMAYSVPIDPAKLEVIPDMDLSYALASTLVEWGPGKKIVSGLALEWEPLDNNVCRFTLRPGARWSDDSPVTSHQVKKSFERMFAKYPEDLRSLINMVSEFKTPSDGVIDLVLRPSASIKQLLGKLTEPNYGVAWVNPNGALNLHVTTGAFFVKENGEDGLVLERNPHWYRFDPGMADQVIIRHPTKDFASESILLNDEWPNLIETSSLIDSNLMKQYEGAHFSIWNRPKDKTFIFELSKRSANKNGFDLFQYLASRMDRKILTHGLSGYSEGKQLFPEGFDLYDPNFRCETGNVALPKIFKERPIEILYSSARVNPELKGNIEREITKIIGKPHFISVSLDQLGDYRKKGQYDFYVGTIGLADPDPEGGMSYYFEGDPPVIPSENNDFVKLLDNARTEKDGTKYLDRMRKILTEATCKGRILPLFYVSSVGLGKPEIDFSFVPETDESVTLSKVRFKRGH
jgi:hypothetical protein